MENNKPGKDSKIFEIVLDENLKYNTDLTKEDLEDALNSLGVSNSSTIDREFKIYFASEANIKMFNEAFKKEVERLNKVKDGK